MVMDAPHLNLLKVLQKRFVSISNVLIAPPSNHSKVLLCTLKSVVMTNSRNNLMIKVSSKPNEFQIGNRDGFELNKIGFSSLTLASPIIITVGDVLSYAILRV